MIRTLLVLSAVFSVSAKAQTPSYPRAAQDIADLKKSVTQQINVIKAMGQFCDGGGRKWAKIEQLKLLYRESEAYERIQNSVATLSQGCARVATTSRQMDPEGNRLVIPQRIADSREILPERKRSCLEFWADWFEFEKIGTEQVSPLLQRFNIECKGNPATSITGAPSSESPANR